MRSDRVIRFAILAAFLAVAAYIGYSLYESKTDPLKTVLCVRASVEDAAETEGWIIREEMPLYGYGEGVTVRASEGDKLAADEVFAVRYLDDEAMEREAERTRLHLYIHQLRELIAGGSGAQKETAAAMELAQASAREDWSGLEQQMLSLRTYVFRERETDETELRALLEQAQNDAALLEESSSDDASALYSPASGIFCPVTDGYEHVTPETVRELGPGELETLMSGGRITHADSVGKLVQGIRWYYAVCVDGEVGDKLRTMDTVGLEMPNLYPGAAEMRVEHVSDPVNGKCTAILSGEEKLTSVLSCRETPARLILSAHSGLRVPAEAVYRDEETGENYVYVLEGLQARRIPVTLLDGQEKWYCVSGDEELREGMEIITVAKELYDGKVVQ